jgi:hypothetical protein
MRLTMFLLIIMALSTACTTRSVEPTADEPGESEPDELEPVLTDDAPAIEGSNPPAVTEPSVANVIAGKATVSVMKSSQGEDADRSDLKTCAGEDALLVKLSESMTEQIGYYMGNADRTSVFLPDNSAELGADLEIDNRSLCDAAGRFEFRDLPDGEYVVIVPVPDGKRLFLERLSVAGGEVRALQMFYRWPTPFPSIE